MLFISTPAYGRDLSHGLMFAVPAPHGTGPKINGSLKGWNTAAGDSIWMTTETAPQMHALAILEYTKRALYFGVRVALPNRKILNPNGPLDAFWWGDEVELRVVADPAVQYPVNATAANVVANPRVTHLTFWKDSLTGKCYLHATHGVKFNLGQQVNPPGSMIKIVEHGRHGYTMTARIPWSMLDAPGGVLPFKPGQRMPATIGIHWGGEDTATALFRIDPGSFAFRQVAKWGQIEFAKPGQVMHPQPQLMPYLASLKVAPIGTPITVQVPRKEKVSINIFGTHGQVIRELMTGAVHKKGPLTVYWDGRNQWGTPVALGTYKWGAYFSPGLKAKYVGSAGTSGTPPYPTVNGVGGWGGDHGPCVDVAADKTGMYFLWTVAEAGRAVIKVNYQDKTIWRTTPFVGGGFGPLYAIASNGRNVFIVFSGANPALVRLSCRTGQMLTWPNGSAISQISHSPMVGIPSQSSPLSFQPETCGVAASRTEVFCPVYSKNQIRVLNPANGRLIRTLTCTGPRGVCLDGQGNLFAVSYVPGQPGKIMEFIHAAGSARVVVRTHLTAPWHVAVDAAGRIHVTDEAASQQVKVFSSAGKLIQTLGIRGGRPWVGKYVATNYLDPAGIAADAQGGILTAQASLPKVMSRNNAASGAVMTQWFGSLGYSSVITPDPRHPRMVYYQFEPAGFARARVMGRTKVGVPQAYWLLLNAGFHAAGTLGELIAQTNVVKATNGRRYFVCDGNPHGIALIKGNQMLPVAHFHVWDVYRPQNPYHRNVLSIWSDTNGDHHVQADEVQRVTTVAGRPLPALAESVGSMWMDNQGDIYMATEANSILEIPATGFRANGSIRWDVAKARYVVPQVLRRAGNRLPTSPRAGILGMRVDSHGNLYTCVDATVRYHSPALTKAMQQGMGHDSDCNTVKFMKFAPDGKLLWMAGRKATGGSTPGSLHHFWVMGGLIGNQYVVGCSEWGQMYIYTHDGFFVSSLMNNPAKAPPPGPYTFGSETFSGIVAYYPARNQVWAYTGGRAYRVLGFDHGLVQGQSRQWGQVALSKIYKDIRHGVQLGHRTHLVVEPLTMPWNTLAAWKTMPVRTIQRNGRPLARVQLAYDAKYLYVRFVVSDTKPPVNAARSPKLAFHDGDSVALDLGPRVNKSGNAGTSIPGEVRILAAVINGHPRLIAMKPVSKRFHRSANYATPTGGHVHFDFVGYIPDGKITLTKLPYGYIATLAVPRSFLAVNVVPGAKLSADVEVNYSGYTDRGLQVLSRNYLFSPENDATTMIDDIPTEARLNSQWWGTAVIK